MRVADLPRPVFSLLARGRLVLHQSPSGNQPDYGPGGWDTFVSQKITAT